MMSLWSLVVFFFKAEDGIRDKLVTGVQTCALPIWMTPISSQTMVVPSCGPPVTIRDRKSGVEGKRGDLGGRRIIKKKKKTKKTEDARRTTGGGRADKLQLQERER